MNITPKHTNVNKQSVVFTWDDNRSRQISIIAPLFASKNVRCTFYVNPGIEDFGNVFASGYKELAADSFEIASHGYSHQNMCEIDETKLEFEFRQSISEIAKYVNTRPVTFAFPFHSTNDAVIAKARECHLETRNTLDHSICIRLKSDSVFEVVMDELYNAINKGRNVIFSGHSVITETEYANNEKGEGWEPIRVPFLENLLTYSQSVAEKAEVVTFAQASIKEFIKSHRLFDGKVYVFNTEFLTDLEQLGIDTEMLHSIL